jgi:hypothetical protein
MFNLMAFHNCTGIVECSASNRIARPHGFGFKESEDATRTGILYGAGLFRGRPR